MKNRVAKRLIPIVITIMMVVTLLPIFAVPALAADTLLTVDFETAGSGYTVTGSISPASSACWERTDGSVISPDVAFTGKQGTYFFYGENTDYPLNDKAPVYVTLNSINVSGKTDLELKISVAGNSSASSAYEGDEYLRIEYAYDGGGFIRRAEFKAANTNDVYMTEDSDGDGITDGATLSPAFSEFTYSIPAGGTNLQIRIVANIDQGSEEIGFDNIRIVGTDAPANAAPVASAVSISGTAADGDTLTGHYTYTDADSDAQGTSTFKWYRADNASGLNKAPISGATASTYTLTAADVGKYICFEVTPVAAAGISLGTAATSAYTLAMAASDTWDGTTDTTWHNTSASSFTIYTAEQLAGLASIVNAGTDNFNGDTITLAADLDLDSRQWTPIGNTNDNSGTVFSGTFSGGAHKISNLTIGSASSPNDEIQNAGLFGYVNGGSISSLGIENVLIYCADTNVRAGGLAGIIDFGSVTNCYVTGYVSGGGSEGGLAGEALNSSVSNSFTAGGVSGGNESTAGGFIGLAQASTGSHSISNCYSTCSVAAFYAGGFFGSHDGSDKLTVVNCYSTGNVTGSQADFSGGFLGYFGTSEVTLTDCYYNSSSTQFVNGTQQTKGVGYGTTDDVNAKTSVYMKSADFIADLNDGSSVWAADSGMDNQGYPVLTAVDPVSSALNQITYGVSNATSGVIPTDTGAYPDGTSVTLAANTGSLERTGYTFGGWNTLSNGTGTNYDVCDSYSISADTNLYAKWNSTLPAPTVTGITPASGDVAGGTSVTITGTDFVDTTAVKFGSTNASSFTVDSATQITATAPAHSAGTVDITVTAAGGTSATSAADRFTFISNDAPVASAVSVSGTATYGQTLTGDYDYDDAEGDLEGTSTFKWYRADNASGLNKTAISGATEETYTLTSADVDKYICFEVTPKAATGTSPGTAVPSAYTAQVQRADCATATGITPVLSSKTDTSVTLTSVAGYEYLRVANDAAATGTWQNSNVFSGLSANTAYDFYQRVKQTATHKASGTSAKLDVTTDAAPIVTTEKFATETDGSLTFTEGGLTFSITGGNLHVRQKSGWGYDDGFYVDNDGHPMSTAATFGSFKSTASDFNVHSLYMTVLQDNAETISNYNNILIRGKLDGVTVFTHTLYFNQINETDANNYLTFVDLSSYSSDVIDELEFAVEPYESYYAAYMMIDDFKFTIANSAPVASAVSVSGTATYGETLTGSYTYTDAESDAQGTSTFKWYRADNASGLNKAPISGATEETYTLTAADVDKYICFEVTPVAAAGTSPGTAATSSYTAQVQRLDCATATGTTPVLSSKTDTSVTLTSVAGYEYLRVANDAAATGTWQNSNVFSGLSANTAYDFYQRVKQTATHKASGISAKLDVTTFDVPATVSSVAVPSNGTYMAGQNLYFVVNFDKIVNVDTTGGTPRIALTIGGTTVYANYYSGSGTSSLTFRYTVEAGRFDNDGIVVGALSLNGGTIQDATGNDATLTLNSVGSTTMVLVDAVVPSADSLTVPADAPYTAGQNLNFTVNFSENVTVNTGGGTPRIALTIGSDTVYADYVSGSSTSSLVFRYTIESGRWDGDGITVASSVSLNGGTIRDAAGNNATLTLTGGTLTGVLVKKTQTITFTNPGAQNFGTSPTLSATSSSGLPVAFSSSTTGVATITSGGALTFHSAGPATINADQAGNDEYLPAATVSQTFTVNAVVPGKPTIGTATAGDTQAYVSFTAPSSTGGATITGYTVTATPGGATGTGAGSPITVTGLTNGVDYTFTVTATNSAGTGSSSAASNSVTPKTAQFITFSNPGAQNFGTSPTLSAYSSSLLDVTFTSGTPEVCTVTSDGKLTFLKAGTATINANQAGNAAYLPATQVSRSFAVNAVAPGVPTSVTATKGDGQSTISFTPPAFTGGEDITGYTVTSSPGGFTGTGMGSPITVTGLTNGVAYTFTVTATNAAYLTSSASAASNSVTPAPVPTVTGISPASGTMAGGTSVTITGTNFTGATAVKFGSTDAVSYTVNSATQITAASPAHSIGTVDVTVTTPGGTSAASAASRFTFADITAPTLSAAGASTVTSSGATLNVTSDEAGTYYYLVYAAADTAPNTATVKAQGTAIAKGTGAAEASANAIDVSGLSASTAYKAYVIVADAADNMSAVTAISFTTKTKLSAPTGLTWDSTVPGKAKWNTVTNASGYSIRLYKDSVAKASAFSVAAGTLYYDFTGAISALGNGTYTFQVMARGDGISFENSDVSAASNGYSYAAPAPTPTPTPTPSPTPSPAPTTTPAPTATPKPAPKPTVTPIPEQTAAPTPSPSATPAPSATPSATPTPAASESPTAVPAASETPSETTGNTRTITGTLLDENGNPMAGYLVELHSDPITTMTDANGRYTFYDVDYTSHDLIVKTPEGEKVAEFELAFSEGEETGTAVTEKGVNITYTRSTATVTIDVALEADESGAAISKVSVSDTPVTASGGIGTVLLWIGGGVLVVALIVCFIIILLKRRKDDKDEGYQA